MKPAGTKNRSTSSKKSDFIFTTHNHNLQRHVILDIDDEPKISSSRPRPMRTDIMTTGICSVYGRETVAPASEYYEELTAEASLQSEDAQSWSVAKTFFLIEEYPQWRLKSLQSKPMGSPLSTRRRRSGGAGASRFDQAKANLFHPKILELPESVFGNGKSVWLMKQSTPRQRWAMNQHPLIGHCSTRSNATEAAKTQIIDTAKKPQNIEKTPIPARQPGHGQER